MQNKERILAINDDLYLTPIHDKDKENLILYLNEPEIHQNTLTIPFPYTERDALFFIKLTKEKEKTLGKNIHWAVRNKQDQLIGVIGHFLHTGANGSRDEIGYWLAKPFWNKGMMTEIVKKFSEYLFKAYPFDRLEAHIFAYNPASARVLEKAGFEREGYLKKYYLKNNVMEDAIIYAKIK